MDGNDEDTLRRRLVSEGGLILIVVLSITRNFLAEKTAPFGLRDICVFLHILLDWP